MASFAVITVKAVCNFATPDSSVCRYTAASCKHAHSVPLSASGKNHGGQPT